MPAPEAVVPRGPVTIEGWAMLPSGPPSRVELSLGEEPLGNARLGLPRPDVRLCTGEPAAGVSGFAHTFDLADHPRLEGEVNLRAVAIGGAGERLVLDSLTVGIGEPPAPPARLRDLGPTPLPHTNGASERLRVLAFTHSLDFGGAQTFLIQLVRGLLALGTVELTVVSAAGGPLREEFERLHVPVHISTAVPIDDPDAHAGRVEELAAWAAPGAFAVALINTATSPTFPGAEVAERLGIPAVWAIHESFPPTILWRELHPAVRERGESVLAGAEMAVFEAEATQRLYEPIVGSERCRTVPYGLEIEPIDEIRRGFDRAASRAAAGFARDAEVVLCVGTIEPRKAQIPLARAFDLISDRHPQANLVFVGGCDNPDSNLLREYVSTLASRDRIRVVPMTAQIHDWYGRADLLACPSDIESLPRVVLEAMAWELPVLATSIFGLAELLEDGRSGWLCPPRDIKALAAGLERALDSSPGDRGDIGRAGRRRLEERHSIEPYCERFAAILDEVVRGGRRGAAEQLASD
jgi:glycosyltransferase involved in cell wall biosynthesis